MRTGRRKMKNNHLAVAMISEHGDPLVPIGGVQAGGQNVYVHELSKTLSKLGTKVDVFTRWENRSAAQRVKFAPRAQVIRIKAGPRQFISKDKFGPLMPEFIEHFLEYIRKNKIDYDLIHCHYYFSGLVGLQLKNILEIPMVETFHSLGLCKRKALGSRDPSPDERIEIEKKIMEKADKIISTSPQEKLNMINDYNAHADKIVVIPPGVNLRIFRCLNNKKTKEKLNIDTQKKVVVFAGKMEKRKGGATLVKSIEIIKRRWPEVYDQLQVFMFSGDPRKRGTKNKEETSQRHCLKATIKKMDLSKKIKLMPGINQDKLHQYYGAADVVVMPSYYEPFGMVAVEAMATGTPVVASDVGGLKWTIENGLTGFRVNPKNAMGFARQIVKILKDSTLADRLGKNAIIRARKRFSWSLVSKNILQVYKGLIK